MFEIGVLEWLHKSNSSFNSYESHAEPPRGSKLTSEISNVHRNASPFYCLEAQQLEVWV